LGFLDETPIPSLNDITPREFMREHLQPRLQYGPEERDMVIIRVVVEGEGYRSPRLTFELVDFRDRESGLLAMNRAVGFPASIAAQMIVNGLITDRGLLSPTRHVPFEPFVAALQERGIHIRETEG
jgi:saccharopine dehydrogenase-like NADP-dependent oxidoreductase